VKSLIALNKLPISNKLMKLRIFCITFFIYSSGFAFDTKLHEFYNNHWKVTKRTIEYIENGEIIVDAKVESQL
jgi:hypothetical protein